MLFDIYYLICSLFASREIRIVIIYVKAIIGELEQFIATYGTDIYSFCVYLTGNRPEAEELYQDTFLKTLEDVYKRQAIRLS